MGSFNLTGPNGESYSVDAPDEQAALSAFSQLHPAAAPLDKYQQAAQDQLGKLKADGVDPSYGAAASFANGATMGALPTIMGALETPAAMIEHRTWSPVEGYNYAKANEQAALEAGNADHPWTNGAANFVGGVYTGGSLAKAGVTAVRQGAGALGTIGGMMADGAGYGASTGFLSGEGQGRLTGAAEGAAGGAVAGAALPIAAKAATTVAGPFVAQALARDWWGSRLIGAGPEQAAKMSLIQAMGHSGQTPAELQLALDNATAAGQPQFTLADALGKAGRDKLSNVVRSPGPGGPEVADFLSRRQAAQGRDVSSALSDGLGVNTTSDRLATALKAQRTADANADYGALRAKIGGDPIWSPELQALTSRPSVIQAIGDAKDIAAERGYSVVNPFTKQADGTLSLPEGTSPTFDFWDTVKRGLDRQIAKDPTNPDLNGTKKALMSLIDSPDYQAAREPFARTSRAIDAIDTGKQAARSGRPEDTIPAYNDLEPGAQAAYRTGYADPLMEQASNGNPGANKALPLMNEGTQAELANMSHYQGPQQPGGPGDIMAQRLARSNEMNATRNRALSGSQTFDNMAEEKSQALEPGLLLDAAHGNIHGLVLALARTGVNGLTGSTPAVRQKLGQLLLTRGPGADVPGALTPAVNGMVQRKALARALASGLLAGGSSTAQEQGVSR